MTDKLEKQFFDTFGIEKRKTNKIYIPSTSECIGYDLEYPQITDRILLELHCKLCDAFNLLNVNRYPAFAFNVEDFKKFTLKDLIFVNTFYKNEYIKHQVQALFEED